jgi:hypothetical protein
LASLKPLRQAGERGKLESLGETILEHPQMDKDWFRRIVPISLGAILLVVPGLWTAFFPPDSNIAARFSARQIMFAGTRDRAVLAEWPSRREVSQVIVGILDVIWINCVIWVGALHFIRRQILWRHGCPMGLEGWLFPWRDAQKLQEIAEAEASEVRRVVFEWINTLISILIIVGCIVMLGAVTLHSNR